jgi:hypothetical protein
MRTVLAALLLLAAGFAAAAEPQRTYPTPEAAASALVEAIAANDTKALEAILGPGSRKLIQSGDPVADRAARARVVQAHGAASRISRQGDAKASLLVGKDDWPLPIPLVKVGEAWRFDAKQGEEEILNRRIGRNELSAVQAVLAYVDAQREYYLRNPARDRLLHYARRIGSSPGKRDGLYFPTKAGEPPSPLGRLYAGARAAGYAKGDGSQPASFHGYHYRILAGQGPHAPGGAFDYRAQGRMIGGFALVAWPAAYGNSGVMTFLVNHEGVVYERDLGPETAASVRKITRFDPDQGWKRH